MESLMVTALCDVGWSKTIAQVLHDYTNRYKCRGEVIEDWGFFVEGQFLIYKTMKLQEIHDAFHQCFEIGFARRPTIAFCDGSGTKEKPCGIGVVIYAASAPPIFIAENIGVGTNNVAELRAVWRVLRAFPDVRRKILIRTDSEYSIGMLTKGHNATANVDLIRAIRKDLSLRGDSIKMLHVDGHEGYEGNEIADQLANIGRKLVREVT